MAILVSACGAAPADPPIETASPNPDPPPSESVLASASPEASEAAGPLYPYVLQWPAESAVRDWQYATAPWDGVSRVDSGGRYTDLLLAREGRLFAFGMPTDGTPGDLRDLVSGQAEEWHGCEPEPAIEEPLTGGGSEGIYGEYACGGSTVARWFGVHEGFGLFVGLIVSGSEVPDDVADLQGADR